LLITTVASAKRAVISSTAKRFDIAAQIADVHVAALLQFRHRRLADIEPLGQFLL